MQAKTTMFMLLAASTIAGGARAQTAPPTPAAPRQSSVDAQTPRVVDRSGMTTGLFGDWGGVRSDLYDRGIDLQISYTAEPAWNPRGGDRQDVTYTGQAIVGASLDMNKLTGIEGGEVQVTLFHRHGPSLDVVQNTGLLQAVQEIYGRGQIARLADAWYRQTFAGGAATLKLGRIPVNSDFATFPCDFQSLAACSAPQGNQPISFAYWIDAPSSNWGAVGKLSLGKDRKRAYAMLGLFQVNPKSNRLRGGFNIDFSGGTGVLIPLELGWMPAWGGDKPGSYKIGAWYETSEATDIARGGDGLPIRVSGLPGRALRGHYGAYLQVRQQLTPSPEGLDKKGLSVFLNVTQFDRRTHVVDSQIAAGLTQTGTFAGRPRDQVAIAAVRTHVNSRLRASDRIALAQGLIPGIRQSEYILEFDYRIVPAQGVRIGPNVQWGIDPGGVKQRQNVLAFGVKTSIAF